MKVVSVLPTYLIMILLKCITILCILVQLAKCELNLPEFSEPIKNMSVPSGSDLEFSCNVRHFSLGYRVAWTWNSKTLLGIGIVKISSNPRFELSRVAKSDDVTQFNLYIYNVKKEDAGTYLCSVNSNPMIEQAGTLEVFENGHTEISREKLNSQQHVTTSLNNSVEVSSQGNGTLLDNHNEDGSAEDANLKQNSSSKESSINIFQNSTTLCIDLNDVWDSAREKISDFLSTIAKFTASYWFS